MEINEHTLKFLGKAHIPEAPELGHAYKVFIDCVIDDPAYHNNEDGTYDAIYKVKPIRAVLEDNKGKAIQSRDTRKRSQQLRAVLYKFWEANANDVPDHDEAYDRTMKHILMNAGELYEKALIQR